MRPFRARTADRRSPSRQPIENLVRDHSAPEREEDEGNAEFTQVDEDRGKDEDDDQDSPDHLRPEGFDEDDEEAEDEEEDGGGQGTRGRSVGKDSHPREP